MEFDPIVVTGMGAVTPLGVGVDTVWKRLLDGEVGTRTNDRFDTDAFGAKIAGLVPDKSKDPSGFDPLDFIDRKDLKKMDLFIQYGIAAAQEALTQAGWMPSDDADQARTATIIGTGVGGSPIMAETAVKIAEQGPRRVSPFTVPAFLANLAAGWVSIRYGFTGPIGAPVTACAASAQAIGDGMRLIQTGEADVVVCGGAEGSVDPISIAGFAAAKALNTSYNDRPEVASRPFDAERAGFVLSEGAAILVIERLSHARKRGAKVLALASGYGTSADAYHLTAGHPDGQQAIVAMQAALKMAGITPSAVGYVNAHATSTGVGDAAELAAISTLFGMGEGAPFVSSTKSSTGHLLGAAGAIEAVFSVMALRDQVVPATRNLFTIDSDLPLANHVAHEPKSARLKHVLSNAFGFGGVNASLVFSAET